MLINFTVVILFVRYMQVSYNICDFHILPYNHTVPQPSQLLKGLLFLFSFLCGEIRVVQFNGRRMVKECSYI